MIKVGIIGYGFSAKTFHLPFIEANDHYQLVGFCSRQTLAIKQKYPSVSCHETLTALIANTTVDLVIITSPNSCHFKQTKYCLENGLHVVVEKPITATSAQAHELNELAVRNGLVLSVYHNRRWDGDFLTIQKLIAQKKLGDLKLFESHFDRFRPNVQSRWREQPGQATGILYDLGSHLIDQALVLFGMPDAITARCLSLREDSIVTDYFHVQLHYEKLEVILHSSPFMAGNNARFRLEGTNGTYQINGLDPQETQLRNNLPINNIDFGYDRANSSGIFYGDISEEQIPTDKGDYREYYQQLASAVLHDKLVPVSAESAMQVIKIIELAIESSNKGMRVNI